MTTKSLEHTGTELKAAVARITRFRQTYQGGPLETPAQLAPHPGPVTLGETVWVHGDRRWRPGLVTRITDNAEPGGVSTVYTVVHAQTSKPDKLRRRRVQLEEIRSYALLRRDDINSWLPMPVRPAERVSPG